jgi:hypothetical protein
MMACVLFSHVRQQRKDNQIINLQPELFENVNNLVTQSPPLISLPLQAANQPPCALAAMSKIFTAPLNSPIFFATILL